MTSPSRYTSTLRFDVGDTGKHLSDGDDDVTGNSVTSSRNSLSVDRPVVVRPRSAGQQQTVAYVRLSAPSTASPGLINGLETVSPPGESKHDHQRQTVIAKTTSRAVSVPASVHRDLDLECSRSLREGEGHQRRFSSDVKVTILQPTRE